MLYRRYRRGLVSGLNGDTSHVGATFPTGCTFLGADRDLGNQSPVFFCAPVQQISFRKKHNAPSDSPVRWIRAARSKRIRCAIKP